MPVKSHCRKHSEWCEDCEDCEEFHVVTHRCRWNVKPKHATAAMPGTVEKMLVMAARAEAGVGLHHRDDAQLPPECTDRGEVMNFIRRIG